MKTPRNQGDRRGRVQSAILLLIMAFSRGLLCLASLVGRRRRWLASFPAHAMAPHLDLLLVALLYGCLFSGALLAAAALALLALLAGALLVTLALAASDARRLAEPAARAADAAAANLRLARAVAVYAVLKAVVRVVLVVRRKIGALAPRVRGCVTDHGLYHTVAGLGFVV
ncbi:hypothetical protein ACP70R_035816 [Stipagrostis hirtigluma subsp. patula]